MKTYIFYGGKEILIVKVDDSRNVSINYPAIFGDKFIDIDTALKKADRNEAAKYNLIKNKASDSEFEGYIIREFTHGKWAGFKLKHIIKK